MKRPLPIITYHALGDVPSPLWTPVRRFEEHLKNFARAGYRTVGIQEALKRFRSGSYPVSPTGEGRSIVIAFDDGYESVYTLAKPRLDDYGFKATLFLVSDYCGRNNRWPTQQPQVPDSTILSWEQAGRLAAAGWELGAHTRSHPPLPALSFRQAEDEIVGSREEIRNRTGRDAAVFAYPYGAADRVIRELVSRHFQAAVGTRLGLAGAQHDPFLLPRLDAFYLHPGLLHRLDGVLVRDYLHLRQFLRGLRRLFICDWSPGSGTKNSEAGS